MKTQRWEESEKRREEERRLEKRKSQKKEDAGVRKGRKVEHHCAFPLVCGSGGSKIRLAKTACAEPSGEMKDEKLHAVVARSTFPSQHVQYKAPHARTAFGSCGAKHILLWRAELLHFHVANFENEEGSQNSFVFKLAERQLDR